MDARAAKLPEVFQRRLVGFYRRNPDFGPEFGGYELFCCEQAVLVADDFGNAQAMREWAERTYNEQKQVVPSLDSNHSGNTFGMACRLAHHYLSDTPEMVEQEHGTMCPLAGCKDYGCPQAVNVEGAEE